MGYEPKPIDLSDIRLSSSLEKDLEAIARNIHETWAQKRKCNGWEHGRVFDEVKKKHPCMIEYEKLPESEKDIDRAIVMQTVKMLLLMGYRIEKREQE